MKLKKIVAAVLAGAMALSMAGCVRPAPLRIMLIQIQLQG